MLKLLELSHIFWASFPSNAGEKKIFQIIYTAWVSQKYTKWQSDYGMSPPPLIYSCTYTIHIIQSFSQIILVKNNTKRMHKQLYYIAHYIRRKEEGKEGWNEKQHLNISTTLLHILYPIMQLPQLPLTSWQSRKVSLVSKSLGPTHSTRKHNWVQNLLWWWQ